MSILDHYIPSGPVAAAYILSDARVCGILGPIGSGKTNASLRKIILKVARQVPSPRDGVRRRRVGIFRNTYTELTSSTMKSWFEVVPQHEGVWSAENRTHRLTFLEPFRAELEVVFMALDRPDDVGKLKGVEFSDAYLNEAVETNYDVVQAIDGRLNRYPPMVHGGCVNPQFMMDTNAPDRESWWYRLFEEEKPEGWKLFKQPGGLSPGAENLQNLAGGRAYYTEKLPGKEKWWIDVMIHAKYAYSKRGMPVFGDEFNDELHSANVELTPLPGRRIIIGLDSDLHPAGSFWQRAQGGQWRGLDEMYRPGYGPRRFGQELRRMIDYDYRGFEVIGVADPAGGTGADKADPNDLTWIQSVSEHAGIKIVAAPTNQLHPRLEAWRLPLSTIVEGQPGLLLSSRMRNTRKGLASGYIYSKIIQPGGTTTYGGIPNKNDFSHLIDAGGYALLSEGGYADVMSAIDAHKKHADREKQAEQRRRNPPASDYNPLQF